MKKILVFFLVTIFNQVSFAQNTTDEIYQLRDWGTHIDSTHIKKIWEKYHQGNWKVKEVAAWSIGQHKNFGELVTITTEITQTPSEQGILIEYLAEAAAKSSEPDAIPLVWELLKKNNQQRWAGKWAFQWILNGKGKEVETYINDIFKQETEIPFAWYSCLGRLKTENFESWKFIFNSKKSFSSDQKFMIAGLGRNFKNESSFFNIWKSSILTEKDPSCLVQWIKATPTLTGNPFDEKIIQTLNRIWKKEKNSDHVPYTIAEWVQRNATYFFQNHSNIYQEWIKSNPSKAIFLIKKSELATNQNESTKQNLWLETKTGKNVYYQGFALWALGSAWNEHPQIFQFTISQNHPVIWNYGMEAIQEQLKLLVTQNGSQVDSISRLFFPYLEYALKSKDDAAMCLAAETLRNPIYQFQNQIKTLDFLFEAMNRCILPAQEESKIEIQKTLDYFGGWRNTYVPSKPLAIIKDERTLLAENNTLKITTNKGSFSIELRPDWSLETVLKIQELVQAGYYNGKVFHRVVPGFVVQTGCPRGDGWGSPGFIMKSNYSEQEFTRGAVGMASAGTDTESAQWFISLAPTPHLNSRYTLLGQVIQGMNIVERLSIGDQILHTEILP
jgi:cyclophilin family peptidyl-prolyl cis-trans isomerase